MQNSRNNYSKSFSSQDFVYSNFSFSFREDQYFNNINFKNRVKDQRQESLVLKKIKKCKFKNCSFDDNITFKNSSDIVFEDTSLNIKNIHNCDNIVFKNCNIENIGHMWLRYSNNNIIFKNCTIKGYIMNISESKISFQNCTFENFHEIKTYNSKLNFKHTKVKNCSTFINSECCQIYMRLLDVKTTDRILKTDKKTSIKSISTPPELFLEQI